MKTTILIKENRTQLVLEPENDHDKEVLKILAKMPNTHADNFYDCEGGWTRRDNGNTDLVIVFDTTKKKGIIHAPPPRGTEPEVPPFNGNVSALKIFLPET